MIRRLILLLAVPILLSACNAGGSNDDALGFAGRSLANLFNRTEPQQITATRASLEAGGFDEPLLVATVRQPVFLRSGLLLAERRNRIDIWRGLDGSTVRLDRDVVRGTVGVGYDLYSAETELTLNALAHGSTDPYPRVYRHLNALNQLDVTRFFCQMSAPESETIVIFDRSHPVLRFIERCETERPQPSGQILSIQNIYWVDRNRLFLWRSDQWISRQIGNILFERVFE